MESLHLIIFTWLVFLLDHFSTAQPYYYPPTFFNYPYNVPPLQTYNICPEPFYYFDYEPLIMGPEPEEGEDNQTIFKNSLEFNKYLMSTSISASSTSSSPSTSKNQPTKILKLAKSNSTNKSKLNQQLSSTRLNKKQPPAGLTKYPRQIDQASMSSVSGPFWEILSQVYEKCCPLNRNRLRPIQIDNESLLYDEILHSFRNQTHILNHQSQGMFSIIEMFNYYQQYDSNYFNPFNVQILSSPGFYLISKRDYNGAPTFTPIALNILLKAWPLLIFILLANAYAAILIWLLDKAMKTRQFPQAFTKGSAFGMFWSYFLFTATSLAPRFNLKTWVIRIFTVIWMMVSLVMIVIFIAMFTSALTVYGTNGESLNQRTVGLYKYSKDRLWLDKENAVAVEFDRMIDMFNSLQEMKINYILLDQVYANFYADLINQKFYVSRQVERKRSYSVFLRGFNSEQLTCFQTTSPIFFQQWIKGNFSDYNLKIKDRSKYFDITDELLYPQRNVILLAAIGLLSSIIIAGISWQITCMKEQRGPRGLVNQLTGGGGGGGGRGRIADANGRGGNGGLNSVLDNLPDFGGVAGGADGGGGGGILGNFGGNLRNIINENPIGGVLDNVNIRNLTQNMMSPNEEQFIPNNGHYLDRTVKFNPLVHNFYYTNKNGEVFKKNLINNDSSTLIKSKFNESEKPETATKNWSYFRINENGYGEMVKENVFQPAKYHAMSSPYQQTKTGNDYHAVPFYNNPEQYFQMQNFTKIPVNSSSASSATNSSNTTQRSNSRDKSIQTNPVANFSTNTVVSNKDLYQYASNGSSPIANNFIKHETIYSQYTASQQPSHPLSNNASNNKYRRTGLNCNQNGIVLNPACSLTSIYNQESNTDESIEVNASNGNSNNLNMNKTSNHYNPMTYTNIVENTKNGFNTNNDSNGIKNNKDNIGSVNLSISSKNGTASILSNPTHKELPRNDSFYFNDSVKL